MSDLKVKRISVCTHFRLNTVPRLFKAALCILLVCAAVCGCFKTEKAEKNYSPITRNYSAGVWITYSELNGMLTSKNGFEAEFASVLQNCKRVGISDIYLHVRAFCDSLCESDYFPQTSAASSFNGDALEYIINECHKQEIRLHAWINPYRVSNTSNDVGTLSKDSPAYIWLNDNNSENDQCVSFTSSGIYLNPAEGQVRALVINGIREILTRYDVDGIHFDDYFYPTTDESFDSESYAVYRENSEQPMELADWRRANVNALISGCYTAIKFTNKDVVFSISPAASIEKNYSELYADAAAWMTGGCVDYIMPQLYFGFEYSADEYKFSNLLTDWEKLSEENGNIKLVVGLAPYKIGSQTKADAEWSENSDILSRQIACCKKSSYTLGYCFFSYSSLFSESEANKKELNNILKEN